MSPPLISAALIVRDEERHLGACLASLEGVVDEVVVVDTGSRDRSIEIAHACGARVHCEPWAGDFARARNAALDRVRGRWTLYIDADERLRPVGRAAVERLLGSAPEAAFRVRLRPFARSTPYLEYRLWRSDPRVRFSGAVHEKVAPAIWRVAAAEARPIGDCDLELAHAGYEDDQAAKHHRNLPLLRAQLAREPGSVFDWRHLGRVLAALGDDEHAERALWRAVELARERAGADRHGSLAYSELARLRHEHGQDVEDLLAEGLELYPGNWLLVWTRARVEIDSGRHESALSWLEPLTHVDVETLPAGGISYDERLFGSFAHGARGLCLFRLGRYREAARAYAAAEACEPGEPEHRVRRQLAELRAG